MSGGVPSEVLGLTVFVNLLSFLALFLGILLILMLWRHGEGLSYILMLSVGTTLGAAQGVVVHLDYTVNWRHIQIMRYEESQKPHYDETAMFGKADTGWRSVFAWLAIYLYNVDSLLVLFWAITLFIGTWNIRVKSAWKKTMAVAFKVIAVILPAIMVAICQIKTLRKYPFAFLVVVNIIMTISMIFGFVLVLAILYKYLMSRNIFKRFFNHASSFAGGSSNVATVSSATTGTRSGTRRTATDKWLIIRFSIIMVILIIFEVALIVYELVNYQRSREIKTSKTAPNGPDFSIEQTKVDLFQYIPGVVPSLVAFCIFGTTAAFRHEYMDFIKTCCRCCSRTRCNPSLRSMVQPWSYGRQRSIDVEATRHQGSFPRDGKSGIAVEVRTEISLSPITNLKLPASAPRRVSFGGTSTLSKEMTAQPDLFINQATGLISPQQTYGTSTKITGRISPTFDARNQTYATHARNASVDKALPAFPPKAANSMNIPIQRNPSVDYTRERTSTSNASSAQGPSWLAPDSKPSSIYAGSEHALSQSSANELFPPLNVPGRGAALG